MYHPRLLVNNFSGYMNIRAQQAGSLLKEYHIAHDDSYQCFIVVKRFIWVFHSPFG